MIQQAMYSLIQYGLQRHLIESDDVVYVRNKIMGLLGISDYVLKKYEVIPFEQSLEILLDYAFEQKLIKHNSVHFRDNFEAKIMDCFIDKPGNVVQKFQLLYSENKKLATHYFYHLSQDSNYIKTNRIKKNVSFFEDTKYGKIDITINVSKPEKDVNQIKQAIHNQQEQYPNCVLCKENEGFAGDDWKQARDILRLIPVTLAGENWYMQYSPYVYYNEHCIVLSESHYQMKIYRKTFQRLLDFVDFLPHYFLGSNAGLPIVGGSILNHDHYQGGNYDFPIFHANVLKQYESRRFDKSRIEVLDWPVSVIKISSEDKVQILELITEMNSKWEIYNDVENNIYSHTGEEQHNAITPICVKQENKYVFYIALRNNKTSQQYPDGMFHVKPHNYHIKKENIGLIEVMGLAILPGRLLEEMKVIEEYVLTGEIMDNDKLEKHLEFSQYLKEKYPNITKVDIQAVLNHEIAMKFVSCLEDTSVFKGNVSLYDHFINTLDLDS